MRGFFVSLIAALAVISAIGCGKKDETVVTPPSTTTTGGTPPANTTPNLGTTTAAMPDFSTPEKAASTVGPYLQGQFAADTTLAGTNLKVEVKDKMVHIMGDVKNNDQKRKIDEITKTIEAPAKAAGYSFMNMAIVKG